MTKEVFIKDVMVKPTSIAKSATITEALDKMLAEGIDPLIVVHNNAVIGTVSRQAIAEKLGSKQNANLAPAAIHVASVVEEDFTSVYPDESINVLIPLLQRYKLVVVYDGQEAVDYIFKQGKYTDREPAHLPALVLLDLKLPYISGLEILKQVRLNQTTSQMPVMILSSSIDQREIDECKKY